MFLSELFRRTLTMSHVPRSELSVLGRILAERRQLSALQHTSTLRNTAFLATYKNSILKLNTANLERLKELRDWFSIRLRIEGSPCRRLLSRSEIRNAWRRHVNQSSERHRRQYWEEDILQTALIPALFLLASARSFRWLLLNGNVLREWRPSGNILPILSVGKRNSS